MDEEEREPRIGVSWVQVAGSALAAVSSAVLLSTLGVAGTVIGAALGSVVATIGTALYTRTLDVSRQQVAAQTAALRRVTRARQDLDDVEAEVARGGTPSDSDIARVDRELSQAVEALTTPGTDSGSGGVGPRRSGSLAGPPAGPSARPAGWAPPYGLSWQRLAVAAGVVFVVAMVAISAFELAAGRAVSTYTGGSGEQTGSTVPGLSRGDRAEPGRGETPDGGQDGQDAEEEGGTTPTGDPEASPTPTPAEDPTSGSPAPSTDPAASPSTGSSPSSPASPSAGPTGTPTAAPSSTTDGTTDG